MSNTNQSTGEAYSWVPFYEQAASHWAELFENVEPPVLHGFFLEAFKAAALPPSVTGPEAVSPEAFDFLDALALVNQKMADADRIRLLGGLKASPLGEGIAAPVPVGFKGLIQVPAALSLRRAPEPAGESITPTGRALLVSLLLSAPALARSKSREGFEAPDAGFAKALDQLKEEGLFPWNITIALYWIAPRFFLPLDRCTKRRLVRRCWLTGPVSKYFEYGGATGEAAGEALERALVAEAVVPSASAYLQIRAGLAWQLSEQRKGRMDPALGELGIPKMVAQAAFERFVPPPTEFDPEVSTLELIEPGPNDPRLWVVQPFGNDLWGDEEWEAYFARGEVSVADDQDLGDLGQYEDLGKLRFALDQETCGHSPAGLASYLWSLKAVKPGDILFAKSHAADSILSRGVVTEACRYERGSEGKGPSRHCVKVRWGALKEVWSWRLHPEWRFADVTENFILTDWLDQEYMAGREASLLYSEKDFKREPFLEQTRFAEYRAALDSGKPIAIIGPKRTGRSLVADCLTWLAFGARDFMRTPYAFLAGDKNGSAHLVAGEHVPQHGLRAQEVRFKSFCRRAAIERFRDEPRDTFFVVRNVELGALDFARGALMDAVTAEYRRLVGDPEAALPHPEKIRFIALVETGVADLIGAHPIMKKASPELRSRYAVIEMRSNFELPGVKAWQRHLDDLGIGKGFREFVSCLDALNQVIEADRRLGVGFTFGHWWLGEAASRTTENGVAASLAKLATQVIAPALFRFWGMPETEAADENARMSRGLIWMNRFRSAVLGEPWELAETPGASRTKQ